MITHSNLYEIFAFNLTPGMFIANKNIPEGKAKAHLIAYVEEHKIIANSHKNQNRMKKVYVDKLIHFINDSVLLED